MFHRQVIPAVDYLIAYQTDIFAALLRWSSKAVIKSYRNNHVQELGSAGLSEIVGESDRYLACYLGDFFTYSGLA